MARTNAQKGACDRCRGQKLRCTWDPNEPQCQRCARANAVCTIPPPRPMGRPPRRQNRSQSTSSHSCAQSPGAPGGGQGMYCWNEQNATPTPPISDGDTDITMNSASVLSDPPEFFPWFPEHDGLNLFAPRSTTVIAPMAVSPPMSTGTATTDSSRPFGLQSEMLTPPLDAGGKLAEENQSNHGCIHEGHPIDLATTKVEETSGDQEQIQLLTQLCELNVALFQHPLHRERDKSYLRPAMTPNSDDMSQPQAGSSPSAGNSPASSDGSSIADLNIGDLRTGSLFQLTCRLKDIITRIRAHDEATAHGPKRYDPSTALMALSCYTRLDLLFSRALDILVRLRNSGPIPESMRYLMPELVIDGFSMAGTLDLQLSFLIHLHEQARDRIRTCIRSAGGPARVGRDKGDSIRQGAPAPVTIGS
ncbi:hypothetical protein MYCTH_2308133 [Thermothelomyces thermophilus ATCC 42464]|uniref:Zn(2)-C6 fungal-type domain-containing protein n=1 Tax=Thermothelomyces thermophilus (strain ATCC 42464 / BCRC 31852 / DSM 1799) TaxID=573729 RepID=G2QJB5_THET4|nr:uncharacterized protein MYCTH_2308133 [Thermothelomyces thermophilus ATCC 42464]AEO59672.1 hypothetical protein MYCTH_2308133 [Thermothelomyces thermophilus ATCC 42464]